MINNDVLRRVRYALSLNDSAMIEIFKLAGVTMERDRLIDLLKRDDQDGWVELDSELLDAFLSGLITSRRGPREQAGPPAPRPAALTNNIILRKLRIALSFRDDDMLRMLELANFRISKSELNALFRQPGHQNYRECGDQIVRNFLQGLALHLRGQT